MTKPSTIARDYPGEAKGRSAQRGVAVVGANRPLRASSIQLFVAIALLSVTGCGFEPVHGRRERSERVSQIESVQIVTDTTRRGQLLKAEIEDAINPGGMHAEKPFVMAITVTETEISLFINPDGTSSRGDMQYNSTYRLTRRLDGKLIDSGSATRVSSYNISETADYATYVSREDARRRGIKELAQDYKLRLANLVPKLNDPNAGPALPAEAPVAPIIRSRDNHETRTTGF